MFTLAVVKFKVLLVTRPCASSTLDGRSLEVKVPRLVSVGELRAAVTARTWVAMTTVGLYVTERMRDNQLLVDVVGRNAGHQPSADTAFALARDACWMCTACFCTNGRSLTACDDCQQALLDSGGVAGVLVVAAIQWTRSQQTAGPHSS